MNAVISRPLHFINHDEIENYHEGVKVAIFQFFSSKIDMSGDLNPESNIATFCFGWIVSNNLPLFNQMIAH